MSKHNIIFYVNGVEHKWPYEKIDFDDVVKLEFPDGPFGEHYVYHVSWKDGPKAAPAGILKENETAPLVNEMKFDVTLTDES